MKITLSISAALLLGTAVASAQTPENALVMAFNIDAISTFDPAQVAEDVTSEILLNTCDTLVTFNPEEEADFIPSLAESWNVSDDRMTLTFTLKDDLVFPDGSPATAGDLAWSLHRVAKLGYGNFTSLAEYGFKAETIENTITAPDDRTLVLQLDRPYPVNLILGGIGAHRVSTMLNRQVLEENEVEGDLGNAWLNSRTECVGPYSLTRWDSGEAIVLDANEHYAGDAPQLPRILIRHVAETGTQRLLIERGDIDIARNLTPDDLVALEQAEGIEVVRVLRPLMLYVALDNAHEAFADPRVRLAMRHLIDYQGLSENVLRGVGIARATPVQFGAFGALDEEEGQPFRLDLDRARELLAEAGYEDGFTASLLTGSSPSFGPIAQNLQQNAAQVGVTLNIEQMANAQLFARTRSRDFDAAVLGFAASVPDASAMAGRHLSNPDNSLEGQQTQYVSWRSSYFDEEMNAAVEEALMETDPERRVALYHDIQRRAMEEGPNVYVMQTQQAAAIRSSVKDWTWNGFRVFYGAASK